MSPPSDGQPSLNQLAQLFPVFFQPPPLFRSQRNVPFQDVIGTLGQSPNEIGVSVGEDGSSQFVVFVSIQRLYTQDVSFHQFGHRANLEHALSVFIPSVSRRTGRRRPEKWSYVSVDLRACPVSDRSTGSHMVPPLRL